MKKMSVLLKVLVFIYSCGILVQAQSLPEYIDQWGLTSQGKGWPILNDSTTLTGDAGIGGSRPLQSMATIRGGFGQDISISKDTAIIVTGQLEFVGGGKGDTYLPLRYALTYQDSTVLQYQYTDSAQWISTKGHYGYEFCPRTGEGTVANGTWGSGTIGVVNNGNWNSTYTNGGPALATILQSPRNAEMVEGIYDWLITVHQLNDTINKISWYLIEENNLYWYGGMVEGPAVTTKFNGISFGISDGEDTLFKIIAAKVDIGDPYIPPPPHPGNFYVDQWGFFGNKIGGWTISNTDYTGNVTISGDAPNTNWSVVRGAFETFQAAPARPLKITGKVEFEGDGFDISGSFRMGIFYTDSAGTLYIDTALSTLPDSTHWTGTDAHCTGYLFIPQSGTNGAVAWGADQGTWGAVVDTVWFAAEGSNNYPLGSEVPFPAAGGAGEYEFELAVVPADDTSAEIKLSFWKGEDLIWVIRAADDQLVTDKFNSIGFALNTGNTVTAVNITDVLIDSDSAVTYVENKNDLLPAGFSLEQNYPNPFNPATNLQFTIYSAVGSAVGGLQFVTLKIYDLLGREVATLVNEEKPAGTYNVKFDGSGLSTGVYFYQLKAGNNIKTKKFIILK